MVGVGMGVQNGSRNEIFGAAGFQDFFRMVFVRTRIDQQCASIWRLEYANIDRTWIVKDFGGKFNQFNLSHDLDYLDLDLACS